MAQSTFYNVKVSGISFIIPDNYIYNVDEYLHLFNNNEKQLLRAKKMVGYGTRYFSPSNITAVDACEVAANDLIKNLNIDIKTIDVLIFVSQVPDYRTPSSSSVLHGRLQLPETCSVFDVNQGCTGYVYGLWLASSLIESKACKKVLLLASDNKTKDSREPKNCYNKSALIFSSGASATMLEYSPQTIPSYFLIGSDGKNFETIISPFGGSRIPITNDLLNTFVEDDKGCRHTIYTDYMDGNAVFYFSINTIPNHVKELLEYSKCSYEDIDFFAFHQANKQIVEVIASSLQIPKNKYSSDTFVNYGNMSGISCLSNLLDKRNEELQRAKNKIVFCSFGVGLSWASAIINIGNDSINMNNTSMLNGGGKFSDIKLYSYPDKNNYAELISYWKKKIKQQFNS